MAAMGISESSIQILWRWSCRQMLHYVKEAPLHKLSDKYKGAGEAVIRHQDIMHCIVKR